MRHKAAPRRRKYKPVVVDRFERQELHCHECQRYVQFTLNVSINGNHVLYCPNCGHEHCRVVENGVITGERWDARNGDIGVTYVSAATITTGTMSTFASYSNGTTSAASTVGAFLYTSWTNWGS